MIQGVARVYSVVLIPSWEQPVVGNLSDKLGAFWELVIGSDASARSLGIGWEPGSQKISLGALKLQKGPRACQLRLGPRRADVSRSSLPMVMWSTLRWSKRQVNLLLYQMFSVHKNGTQLGIGNQ